METYQWIALAVTGVVAGVLGGMLGLGGSIIMIPVMVVLCGIGQHLAQGAAMIVNVCVAVPSAIRHVQARAVHGRVVAAMIPAAVVGVVVGVAVSDLGVFHERFGVELAGVVPAARELEGQQLLTVADGRMKLTARGLVLADSVISRLAAGVEAA